MPKRIGPAADLRLVISWVAALWAIFLLDIALSTLLIPGSGLRVGYLAHLLGLRPLDWWGLLGIPCAHFLHASFAHLVANSIALLILGWLSCRYSRRLTAAAIVTSVLFAGIFTWFIGGIGISGPPPVHIGASGVIFGLIGFLLVNGLVRFDFWGLLVSILTGLLFWRALPGMLPGTGDGQVLVSWQMHLGGFLGGVMTAWRMRREKA